MGVLFGFSLENNKVSLPQAEKKQQSKKKKMTARPGGLVVGAWGNVIWLIGFLKDFVVASCPKL